MGKADFYKPHDNNVICDRCGRKRKASSVKLTWNNLYVCSDTCWEPRQPQDFVKAKIDDQKPKISRPEPTDVAVGTITGDDL